MNPRALLVLVLFLALTLFVGWQGSLVTAPAIDGWYAGLEKAAWTPPRIAFPLVWTTLYVLMALAAWRVWLKAGWHGAADAHGLFFTQLFVNALWPWAFFGLRSPFAGLLCLAVLLPLIFVTMLVYRRYDRPASWAYLPYAAWGLYAASLNFEIWRLNP